MPAPTRRRFVQSLLGISGGLLGPSRKTSATPRAEPVGAAARYTFTQYHNQTAASPLHAALVRMWAAVATETGGRVAATVVAENNHVAGSDPAALAMLVAGEIQFFTLMGGILGNLVPVAEVQQVPFAFPSARAAHRAMDGPLGRYVAGELAGKGVKAFPISVFDNGLRQIATRTKPVRGPDDLIAMRIRVPDGRMFRDVFSALGAQPVTINVDGIYPALSSGQVDAQENPLAVVELFKLYEVVTYMSMTNHMWSGFNLIAHLGTWDQLPADIQKAIERNVARAVRAQRREQLATNDALRSRLAARGLAFNDQIDPQPFRARLADVYRTTRTRLGSRCWALLEAEVGKLA